MSNKSATGNKMAGTLTAAWSQLVIQTEMPASGNAHPPSHQTGFSTATVNYLSFLFPQSGIETQQETKLADTASFLHI
jgi:hypothetical protein